MDGRKNCAFIGYKWPYEPNPLPQIIPADHLCGEIDWDKSSASWRQVEYVDIRVVPADWISDLDELLAHAAGTGELPNPNFAASTHRSKSADSAERRKNAARTAFKELRSEGKITGGMGDKERRNLIADKVAETDQSMASLLRELGPRTVNSYIKDLI